MSARKPLSGLSADSPKAGVSKPYVEPALAGDNKAFDFSRELFTTSIQHRPLLEGMLRTSLCEEVWGTYHPDV